MISCQSMSWYLIKKVKSLKAPPVCRLSALLFVSCMMLQDNDPTDTLVTLPTADGAPDVQTVHLIGSSYNAGFDLILQRCRLVESLQVFFLFFQIHFIQPSIHHLIITKQDVTPGLMVLLLYSRTKQQGFSICP